MPLDLEPVLDLEPLEEDRPPEREDRPLFSEPPPVLMGKPEVLVEGTTRAVIPASLKEPEAARVVVPFTRDEFTQGTPENPLGVSTPEERAFTAAQPSEFDRPVIPPGIFRTALDIGSATLPPSEMLEGFKEGAAEQLAGMTSQSSLAMTPAFTVPYVGPALAMGMGAKALGSGAGTTVGGIEAGDTREVGRGLSEVVGGAGMLYGGGVAARAPAPIPPRILETIVKHGETLPKAAAAVTKAVTKEQPKEVTSASSQPKAAEIHGDVRPLEKPAEVVPAQESSAGIQPRAGEPPRAEGGAQGEVLLKPEVVRRIETMPDAEAAKLSQRGEQYEGLNLTPADVPALEAARVASGERIQTLFAEASKPDATPESQLAAQAELGRNIWLSGAIETANKKGPNYAAAQTAKAVQQPAPVDAARVAGVPEKLPVAEAAPTVVEAPNMETVAAYRAAEKESRAEALRQQAESDAKLDELLKQRKITQKQYNQARYGGLTKAQHERMMEAARKTAAATQKPPIEVPRGTEQAATVAPEALTPEPAGGGAPVAGLPTVEAPTFSASAKVLADKLREQFKTETGGKTFTGPVEIINAAVEIAAKVIEYGGSAADAMAAAVKHVRDNFKGQWDEAAFRKQIEDAIKIPDTAGESIKMRKSAERATESPMIPEAVQERIRTAEESQYRQQAGDKVEDAVKAMSDAQLSAIPPDSNLFVAARLERAVRDFAKGEMDAGYNVFVELEKQGTSFGQNVNQFKRLEGAIPEYVAFVIDKKLKAAGKDPLTPEQQATAIETARAAKAADASLDAATRAWEKKPTAENAAKAESALDASNAAAVELQKFVAKFEPRSTASILKSVLQGNLLTPISEVANIVGNMSFLPFRALDRTIASGLDIIDSAVRGKPRELAVQPLAGTAEALKGVARGAAKIPEILAKGTGNVIKGETRAGLHPVQAWINQFAKNPEMPTTGGKLTLKDRLNLAIEGTFGMSAEAMLRGLGSGDAPFKEGARARVTAEQLRLADVPRDQWPFAQKFPELFLGKRALDQIHKDTLAAVFQGESKALNYLTNLAKSRGEVMDLMVATVAPYKLTPWNIVSEILSYNPLVAMLKGVNDVRKGDTRNAKLNAGKLVVGSMLTGAGIWLYKNGLLAPSLDERNEAQKARVLSGQVLPPNHINISGLERAMKGGDPAFQPGDETRDVFRAGGLAGSIFYMTANIGRDMERGPEVTDSDMWMSIIRQSTLEQARFGLNQSFLSGIEGLLTAVKEGKGDNFLRQWMNTVTSIPLPNTLNTISRASREYQVDTKGDLGAQFKSKLGLAGLDDYLPLKRDLWGQPIPETPEGREAFFYHFFDITKGRQVTSDPVPLELYRLWRKTGDNAAIPSIPERNTTVAKTTYALEPAQYERYAELVGGSRREIVDALVINPEFHKLNDEQKLKVLSRAYDAGLERGKGVFYQEFQGKLTPKAGRSGFR